MTERRFPTLWPDEDKDRQVLTDLYILILALRWLLEYSENNVSNDLKANLTDVLKDEHITDRVMDIISISRFNQNDCDVIRTALVELDQRFDALARSFAFAYE